MIPMAFLLSNKTKCLVWFFIIASKISCNVTSKLIESFELEISLIKDVTPIPHNGCRPPKRRRV